MNHQQKLVALAGGSALVFVLGFAFFVLKRRSQKDDDESEDQIETENELPDLNTSIASAGQSVVELMVPKRMVGSIIGKGGSNIKQLKNEFAVRLDFEREEDLTEAEKAARCDERKLFIRGEREKVLACELKIKQTISEAPEYVEKEMLVPQESCGQIIGKGGQSIREMCNMSGARIKVDRDEDPGVGGLRKVKLSGTSTQVDFAQALIEEKVALNQSLRDKDRLKASTNSPFNEYKVKEKPYKTVSLPQDSEFFQVFVSAFDGPDHIWIQLINKEGLKLDALNKELTDMYAQLKDGEDRLESGRVGTLCISPFDHDSDQWYRAVIKSISRSGETAQVQYIDFGDVCLPHINQLKNIRPEHKELPAQAVECFLPISSNGPWWTSDAETHFEELSKCAQWVPLTAKVIGNKVIGGETFPVLELFENDLNICEVLVSQEEARWNELKGLIPVTEKSNGLAGNTLPSEIEIPTMDFTSTTTSFQEAPVVESDIQIASEDLVETYNKESSIFGDLASVKGSFHNDTQDTADSGIVKDDLSSSVSNEAIKVKEEKSDINIKMRSEESSHSSPTPDADVPEIVSFGSDQSPTLNIVVDDQEDNKISTSEKSQQEQQVTKQDSLDDSFVDIDVKTIDGAITAIVSNHIPTHDTNEEKIVALTEGKVESGLPASPDEHNETLVKDADDDVPIGSDDEEENELQRSLDETSRKNVHLLANSMELARENLVLMDNSDTTDNDSFYSVRSDITVTDTDNASFMTANERLTPVNDLSFSIPDLSSTSPYGSNTELSSKTVTSSNKTNKMNGSKFEIQFIDEKTHKVMSRESLTASFDANQQKRLSSASLSPGKETSREALTASFDAKQQKRLSGPPLSPGKETTV